MNWIYNMTFRPLLLILLSAVLLCSCDDDGVELSESDVPYSGLPQMSISTPGGTEVKRQYVEHSQLAVSHGGDLAAMAGEIMIKGRGNTSWIFPKKPYSIRLTGGQPTTAEADTSWVLLANYEDKSLMRNEVAFFMGRELSRLDYTPQSHTVDFALNGHYQGIYLLCQAVSVGAGRVDVGDDGLLIEVDGKARYHETIFKTSRLTHPLTIHHPEVREGDARYEAIKAKVQAAEDALFSDHFRDAATGYRRHIDMESMVEWYLVNEIAKNADAAFYTSCFMHARRDGLLTMGPLWDFGSGFGGYKDNDFGRETANVAEGFYIRRTKWMGRLFDDPDFVALVKRRFDHYYAHRSLIYDHIDQTCAALVDKVYYDNLLWGQLKDRSSSEEEVRRAYREEADYLKDWIERRMRWLKSELDKM